MDVDGIIIILIYVGVLIVKERMFPLNPLGSFGNAYFISKPYQQKCKFRHPMLIAF